MAWYSERWVGSVILGATLVATCGVGRVWAQKSPPPLPTKVKQFPKPTSRPPVPKIIRLAPGQKVITAEQLRKAPTVYAVNQRGKLRVGKPTSLPASIPVPGAPPILRERLPYGKQNPAPKKPPVKK